ncbi:hypothetical protein [Alkaliphilus crotonatoxidans]
MAKSFVHHSKFIPPLSSKLLIFIIIVSSDEDKGNVNFPAKGLQSLKINRLLRIRAIVMPLIIGYNISVSIIPPVEQSTKEGKLNGAGYRLV